MAAVASRRSVSLLAQNSIFGSPFKSKSARCHQARNLVQQTVYPKFSPARLFIHALRLIFGISLHFANVFIFILVTAATHHALNCDLYPAFKNSRTPGAEQLSLLPVPYCRAAVADNFVSIPENLRQQSSLQFISPEGIAVIEIHQYRRSAFVIY